MLNDVTNKPAKSTRDEFRSMITIKDDDASDAVSESSSASEKEDEPPRLLVSEMDLRANLERTSFHLRMSEIVRQNSGSAESTSLVVLTLPLPKKGVPEALYLAWLQFLAEGVEPPFLMVRGNQESVLTFYS